MRSKFICWYNNEFKQTKLYIDMASTTEGSPYHREGSVGIHTDMVVMEYLSVCSFWNKADLLGAFSVTFHDVGKPRAKIEKYREDRGKYFAFHGHEILSARMWEDWSVANWSMLKDRFKFVVEDIFRVSFMIEHHVPWRITKNDKLNQLGLTLCNHDLNITFLNVIIADTTGRISDDWDQKLLDSNIWCDDFQRRVSSLSGHSILYEVNNPSNKPILYVLIGSSGSGKSTFVQHNHILVDNTFSLDLLRLERYGEPYVNAFYQSIKDPHFRTFCNERYREMLQTKTNLILDNTNISRKARRFFITEARNRGYFVIAVLFPATLQQVLDRQHTRDDKKIPDEAVEKQYWGIQMPQYGEVDDISFMDGNLS